MAYQDYLCPFCDKPTTIETGVHLAQESVRITKDGIAGGPRMVTFQFILCPNNSCRALTLEAWLHKLVPEMVRNQQNVMVRSGKLRQADGDAQSYWRLIPSGQAKVLPSYVPPAIVSDYEEACSIRDLSPKASATLARRALQGMIRDFWGISKRRLYDEISELQGQVDTAVWQAIDAVRRVGNIGAHMENDVGVVVDVDPGEAQMLIELLERLIKEWYINREERAQAFAALAKLAMDKDAAKKG